MQYERYAVKANAKLQTCSLINHTTVNNINTLTQYKSHTRFRLFIWYYRLLSLRYNCQVSRQSGIKLDDLLEIAEVIINALLIRCDVTKIKLSVMKQSVDSDELEA
jgi:hypothetical protein